MYILYGSAWAAINAQLACDLRVELRSFILAIPCEQLVSDLLFQREFDGSALDGSYYFCLFGGKNYDQY